MRTLLAIVAAVAGLSACYHPSIETGDSGGTGDDGGCSAMPFGAPVLVPEVSSTDQDGSPTLSTDLLTLYFSSDRPGGQGGTDLYVATRHSVGEPFGAPENMAILNSFADDGGPSISPDGLRIYYHSARDGGRDLLVAERSVDGGSFGSPTALGILGGTAPDVSSDGLTLYFGSTDASGRGGADLWVTTRPSDGAAWTPARNLAMLNTAGDENAPSISADGLTLYFSSNAADAATDVMVATRADPTADFAGAATDPVADRPSIGEYDPDVSQDGTTLSLSLHRDAEGLGMTDIWLATRECPR